MTFHNSQLKSMTFQAKKMKLQNSTTFQVSMTRANPGHTKENKKSYLRGMNIKRTDCHCEFNQEDYRPAGSNEELLKDLMPLSFLQ